MGIWAVLLGEEATVCSMWEIGYTQKCVSRGTDVAEMFNFQQILFLSFHSILLLVGSSLPVRNFISCHLYPLVSRWRNVTSCDQNNLNRSIYGGSGPKSENSFCTLIFPFWWLQTLENSGVTWRRASGFSHGVELSAKQEHLSWTILHEQLITLQHSRTIILCSDLFFSTT